MSKIIQFIKNIFKYEYDPRYDDWHPIRDGTPDEFHMWCHGMIEDEFYKSLIDDKQRREHVYSITNIQRQQ